MKHAYPDEPGLAEGVMLDIGEGAGALVLVTDARLAGAEIEVSRDGSGGMRTHAQVHLRRAGGTVRHAAVFAALDPGRYALLRADGSRWMPFEVSAGAVTELDVQGSAGSYEPPG
jgi:hypothetical protein